MKFFLVIFILVSLTSCTSKDKFKRKVASTKTIDKNLDTSNPFFQFISRIVQKGYFIPSDLKKSDKNLCVFFTERLSHEDPTKHCKNETIALSQRFTSTISLYLKAMNSQSESPKQWQLDVLSKEILGLSLKEVETCQGESLKDLHEKSSLMYECYSQLAAHWGIANEALYQGHKKNQFYFLFSSDYIGFKKDSL